MTDVLAVLAYLLLPLIGLGIWRVGVVGREPLGVRIAIATAAGGLIVGLTMALLSLIGVQWSRTVLFSILFVVAIAGWWLGVRSPKADRRAPAAPAAHGLDRRWLAGTVFLWLVTLYGTLTARESCGDLHFTWGPKAIRFFRAGKIDAELLQTYPQLTTDYPPLQTLLFAWSNTVSHQFS